MFIAEASYLNTGYAGYGKEVIRRFRDSGKYEVAEFSIYGSSRDPKRSQIPWKTYPNKPNHDDPEEMHKHYHGNDYNQFGMWRFERVCLDFKPDIVCSIRDHWMDSFINNSPYRRLFKWIWMPTVDAAPQNEEWINTMNGADAILTYSDWAGEVIKSQGVDAAKVIGSAPPCANSSFRPVDDKRRHKEQFGFDPDCKVIGTVMRNQRRKMFPELFEAFRKFLDESGHENTYLYCHTSYPDNGWPLSKYLVKNEICNKVLFTYCCQKCGDVFPSFFYGPKNMCKKCNEFSAGLSNVGNGPDQSTLAKIFNLFDLYLQCANSEGFGMPQVEAAQCGVPVASTDYSAMSDIIEKIGGTPIKYDALFNEFETGCMRAIPDIDSLVDAMKFVLKPAPLRSAAARKTLEKCEEHYNWNNTASKWMEACDFVFDGEDTWNGPPNLHKPAEQVPDDLNNKQFVEWAILQIMGRPDLLYDYNFNCVLRDLNYGGIRNGTTGKMENFTREMCIEALTNRRNAHNFWEAVRTGQHEINDEEWLH